MSSPLPKITPSSSIVAKRSTASTPVSPSFLPKSPGLSTELVKKSYYARCTEPSWFHVTNSADILSISVPKRVNPTDPPWPAIRQYTSMETVEPHWHNEKRALLIKHQEHWRNHHEWATRFYGTNEEKEKQKALMRAFLKQQMEERWSQQKSRVLLKMSECTKTIEQDRQDSEREVQARLRQYNYLKTFRDENKQVMDMRWSERRKLKDSQDADDRALQEASANLINPTKTLT